MGNLVVLEDVSGVGETVGVGDKRLSNVGDRVFPAGVGEVFGEDTVACEHTKYTLEILGIAADGTVLVREVETREDLSGGERRVVSVVPDSVGDA